jgi:capsular exopolysaccharide synthesis family protein
VEQAPRPRGRAWSALLRRRWSIGTVCLIALAAALIASLLTTPLYRASVLLQIEPDPGPRQGSGQATGPTPTAAAAPADAPDTKDFFETQYALLRSRTLARRVIDQLGLTRSPALTPAARLPWLRDLIGAGERLPADLGAGGGAPRAAPDLETIFLANLTVTPLGNSRLVSVAFDSPNPAEAAAVAQTLAENFVNSGLERRYEASVPARAFLDERLRAAQAALADAERRLAAYADEHRIIDLDGQRTLLLERLKALGRQETAAFAAQLAAQTEARQAGTDAAATDSPVIQRLQARKAELSADYQQQLKVFKPGYPKMQQLRRALAELERQLRQEATAIGSAARAAAAARAHQEARLAERGDEVRAQLRDLQVFGGGYRVLEREVADHQERHDALLARMKSLESAAGPGINPIAIVDRAQVPRAPYRPDLGKNLSLALALGLLGGVALALVREARDDRLRTAHEVQRHTGAPVLALIPQVGRGRAAPANAGPALLTWRDPASPLAEAFRTLRTALVFATPAGAPRVMHFASAAPHEGKSSAACATAIAFAAAGSRVLLIDADLRRPCLHQVFGLSNAAGLSDGLTGTAAPLTQATAVDGLHVLTSGPPPTQPVERLAGARMGDLIADLGGQFDHLILDGPPVMGLADALVLAHLADATLLVVTAGRTRTGALAETAQRLRSADANLLGTLLITPDDGVSRYGYGAAAPDSGRDAVPHRQALPPRRQG